MGKNLPKTGVWVTILLKCNFGIEINFLEQGEKKFHKKGGSSNFGTNSARKRILKVLFGLAIISIISSNGSWCLFYDHICLHDTWDCFGPRFRIDSLEES